MQQLIHIEPRLQKMFFFFCFTKNIKENFLELIKIASLKSQSLYNIIVGIQSKTCVS